MLKKFEWDDSKNKLNQEKHSISFEEAITIFDDIILSKIDDRNDYKEVRKISLGKIKTGEIIICVVHTNRNNKTRIISARKANKKEREIYINSLREINYE